MTGSQKTGAWKVRGEQLGTAIGALVQFNPKELDFKWADAVVLVKRVREEQLQAIRRNNKFLIWDIVDAWPQPEGNEWGLFESIDWLHSELERIRPNAVVFTTSTMQNDAGVSIPSIVLPHHSWERYLHHVPNIRRDIQSLGYEGGEHYLGKWRSIIQQECDRHGWRFIVNGDMTTVDIGVALRDCSGYPTTAWKSNCKLANLHALGLPSLCSYEHGMVEFRSGSEFWIRSKLDIYDAFDMLLDVNVRKEISTNMKDAQLCLNYVAGRYKAWLSQLRF